MNSKKMIPFIIMMMSISPFALAAGEHAGHDSMMGLSMGGHWMAPAAEAARANPVKSSADSIQQGGKLYQQYCASCHGGNADGQGMAGMMLNPKPANLRVMAGQHPDGDFAYKIREGRGPMPAWKGILKDDQVWNLVNFIQALNQPPAETQQGHAGHMH